MVKDLHPWDLQLLADLLNYVKFFSTLRWIDDAFDYFPHSTRLNFESIPDPIVKHIDLDH